MLRPVLCRPVLRVRCVLHELIEMIIAQKIMLRKQQKRIDPSSRMHRREHVGNIPFFAPYQIHADAAKKQSIFRLLFAVSFPKNAGKRYHPIFQHDSQPSRYVKWSLLFV